MIGEALIKHLSCIGELSSDDASASPASARNAMRSVAASDSSRSRARSNASEHCEPAASRNAWSSTEKRWGEFEQLLASPRLPGDIR